MLHSAFASALALLLCIASANAQVYNMLYPGRVIAYQTYPNTPWFYRVATPPASCDLRLSVSVPASATSPGSVSIFVSTDTAFPALNGAAPAACPSSNAAQCQNSTLPGGVLNSVLFPAASGGSTYYIVVWPDAASGPSGTVGFRLSASCAATCPANCTACVTGSACTTCDSDSGSILQPSGACVSTAVCAAAASSCGACTAASGCGWCASTSQCVPGTASGPSQAACPAAWTTACSAAYSYQVARRESSTCSPPPNTCDCDAVYERFVVASSGATTWVSTTACPFAACPKLWQSSPNAQLVDRATGAPVGSVVYSASVLGGDACQLAIQRNNGCSTVYTIDSCRSGVNQWSFGFVFLFSLVAIVGCILLGAILCCSCQSCIWHGQCVEAAMFCLPRVCWSQACAKRLADQSGVPVMTAMTLGPSSSSSSSSSLSLGAASSSTSTLFMGDPQSDDAAELELQRAQYAPVFAVPSAATQSLRSQAPHDHLPESDGGYDMRSAHDDGSSADAIEIRAQMHIDGEGARR